MSNDGRSILSAYKENIFLATPMWKGLRSILARGDGGTVGLSGPRGSGKTWLMHRANQEAERAGGLGVWFPSPSEYEPVAFISALSDVVAGKFIEVYDKRTKRLYRSSFRRFLAYFTLAYLLGSIGALLILVGLRPTSNRALPKFLNVWTIAGALMAIAALILARVASSWRRKELEGQGRIRAAAEDLQLQVRFALSVKESSEIGAEAKRSGLGATLKRAAERQMVERPATLSRIIGKFRDFVQSLSNELDGPVIIAIDELDKMTDSVRVAQLLRDIKGVFEIPGAYILVSISDEAARSLELSSIKPRNEFNSSFYTVLGVPPLSPNECVKLIRLRDASFDLTIGRALAVMSGGNARELVRSVDAVSRGGPQATTDLSLCLFQLLRDELLAFQNQALATMSSFEDGSGVVGNVEPDPLWLFREVSDSRLRRCEEFRHFAAQSLLLWTYEDRDTRFHSKSLIEEWHRLTVRLAVASFLMVFPYVLDHAEDVEQLQAVTRFNSSSATVARARFLEIAAQIVFGRDVGSVMQSRASMEVVSLALHFIASGEKTDEPALIDGRWSDDLKKLESLGVVRFRRFALKDRVVLNYDYFAHLRASDGEIARP